MLALNFRNCFKFTNSFSAFPHGTLLYKTLNFSDFEVGTP